MHHVAWLALGRPPRTVAGPTAPIARHGPQRRFPAPLLRPLGEPSRQVQDTPRRPLASARTSRCRLGAARALGWRRIAASESRAPRNEPYTDHRCWRTASWGSWWAQPTGKGSSRPRASPLAARCIAHVYRTARKRPSASDPERRTGWMRLLASADDSAPMRTKQERNGLRPETVRNQCSEPECSVARCLLVPAKECEAPKPLFAHTRPDVRLS